MYTSRMKLPLGVVIGLCLTVFFAGFISPYSPSEQDRAFPFAPPSGVHFVDASGQFHFRPFAFAVVQTGTGEGAYQVQSIAYPLRFLVTGSAYRVGGFFGARLHLFGVDPPGKFFLLGTDGYGRDQFTRLLHGGQISLAAGLLAAALSLSLGLLAGATAGFYGRWMDDLLMRTSELFSAVPWLYLLLAVRAVLPLHLEPRTAFMLVVVIVGSIGWARPARLIRGIVLSAKERNFVLAARGFGATNRYLLRRHLLPETYPVLLTQSTLLIPRYILAEVTLSFLGLGVGEPVASWGNMLGWLQHYNILVSYWWMLAPVMLLIPLFLAFQRLADLLQFHLQPLS
jgi:peptide/nickel transport system permease protein